MVMLRRVETDADYEAARRVSMAVAPHERAETVAQMRAAAGPELLLLLAERGGVVVGSASADRSHLQGAAVVTPQVLPRFRRQGIGTEMLRVLVDHAATLGTDYVVGYADDEGSKAFADRFGFVEVDRQVEQVRQIGVEPVPPRRDDVEVITVAERPELWDAAYTEVAEQAFEDMALISPMHATLEEWRTSWIGDPATMFVALHDGRVIGLAGLIIDDDAPHRAENALTAVRRDWRGKGIAAYLKRLTLAHAAKHGIREVYTWTQKGNADMRRLNEHLGYHTRLQSFTMRAPSPVTIQQTVSRSASGGSHP
jgi:mycothiol synthase